MALCLPRWACSLAAAVALHGLAVPLVWSDEQPVVPDAGADSAQQQLRGKKMPLEVRPSPLPDPAPEPSPSPAPSVKVVVPGPEPLRAEHPLDRAWGVSASVNVPHPLWLELERRQTAYWSFGLGGGGLKLSRTGSKGTTVSAGIAGVDLRARWHPFGGAFFLGTAVGGQNISGLATDPITISVLGQALRVNTTVNGNVTCGYFTPHLGWLWRWDSGFFLGLDLGAQIPFGVKTKADISTDRVLANEVLDVLKQTQEYKDLYSQVQDLGNQIGSYVLPYLTVIRFGWFF